MARKKKVLMLFSSPYNKPRGYDYADEYNDPDNMYTEKDVLKAREGLLPYPHRALRTDDFLYIRNFKPNRWPEGNPHDQESGKPFSKDALTNNTFTTFADMDAGPTKAWLVMNGDTKEGKRYYDFAFGKRPGEELYDLKSDPDQVVNLASDKKYASVRKKLSERLITTLRDNGDPRVQGDGSTFDKAPYVLAE